MFSDIIKLLQLLGPVNIIIMIIGTIVIVRFTISAIRVGWHSNDEKWLKAHGYNHRFIHFL